MAPCLWWIKIWGLCCTNPWIHALPSSGKWKTLQHLSTGTTNSLTWPCRGVLLRFLRDSGSQADVCSPGWGSGKVKITVHPFFFKGLGHVHQWSQEGQRDFEENKWISELYRKSGKLEIPLEPSLIWLLLTHLHFWVIITYSDVLKDSQVFRWWSRGGGSITKQLWLGWKVASLAAVTLKIVLQLFLTLLMQGGPRNSSRCYLVCI